MNLWLTSASLLLTRACNLRCQYCFNGTEKLAKRMSWPIAKRSIDFLFDNASKKKAQVHIDLWGGEPLLEWDLLQKVVLYAESVSQKMSIPVTFGGTTNGILLTEDKFKFLDEHKILFLISFDGSPKSHNKYRLFPSGEGSHSIVLKNLKQALRKWPNYGVRMSVHPEIARNFFSNIKYIADLGVRRIMFSPVYEGDWTEEDWSKWEDEYYKVVDFMAEKSRENDPIEIVHLEDYCVPRDPKFYCGAGKSYGAIDVDGAVYPCHRFIKFSDTRDWRDKEVCIGHIKHEAIHDKFRKKFIYNKACKKCELANCQGSCFAINYDFTGDINTHFEGLCRYGQMQVRVSKYMMNKQGLKRITPQAVMDLLRRLELRIERLEKKL